MSIGSPFPVIISKQGAGNLNPVLIHRSDTAGSLYRFTFRSSLSPAGDALSNKGQPIVAYPFILDYCNKHTMFLDKAAQSPTARVAIAAFWLLLATISVSAPILAKQALYSPSSVIYFLFSAVCHQMPERSFMFEGFPFAVCHRCFGIYLGLAIGSLIKFPFHSYRTCRIWIAAASLPLIFDLAFPLTGLGNNVPVSRFLTGILFGVMLASISVQGVLELIDKLPRRQTIWKGEVP